MALVAVRFSSDPALEQKSPVLKSACAEGKEPGTLKKHPYMLTVIASGSDGNCALLEHGQTRILIDAGISAKKIREGLAKVGRSPEGLSAVILTHEHSDHIIGLGTLCANNGLPVYCNRLTAMAVQSIYGRARFNFRYFNSGQSIQIGEIGVDTVPILHDAIDPVGLLFHADERLGFFTDLGYVSKMVAGLMKKSTLLVIESNHDEKMVATDQRRPDSLKRRVLGRYGHLSNEAAAKTLEGVMTADMKRIYLGHLSRDCNTPEKALETVQAKMGEIGSDAVVEVI